jgi:AcrR family transcriptional regulator
MINSGISHKDFMMSHKKGLDSRIIFETAAELAEKIGLDKVTLFLVAERLGVKSSSLYNHLDGLQDLSSGIARLGISRLDDAVRNAAIGRSKEEALKAMASAYRNYAKSNPELYKAILRYPIFTDQTIHEAGQNVVRILYQVMEPYHYTEEEIIHFVRGFRSALHGFVSLEEAGFFQSTEANVDESYDRMVSLWISGLIK